MCVCLCCVASLHGFTCDLKNKTRHYKGDTFFDSLLYKRVQIQKVIFLSLKDESLTVDIHLTENVSLCSRLGQDWFPLAFIAELNEVWVSEE